jgi:hypothetical protein
MRFLGGKAGKAFLFFWLPPLVSGEVGRVSAVLPASGRANLPAPGTSALYAANRCRGAGTHVGLAPNVIFIGSLACVAVVRTTTTLHVRAAVPTHNGGLCPAATHLSCLTQPRDVLHQGLRPVLRSHVLARLELRAICSTVREDTQNRYRALKPLVAGKCSIADPAQSQARGMDCTDAPHVP